MISGLEGDAQFRQVLADLVEGATPSQEMQQLGSGLAAFAVVAGFDEIQFRRFNGVVVVKIVVSDEKRIRSRQVRKSSRAAAGSIRLADC